MPQEAGRQGYLREEIAAFAAASLQRVSEGPGRGLCHPIFFDIGRDEAVALTLRASAPFRQHAGFLRRGLPGPVTDEHFHSSVGGGVSLMLSPIVAAYSAFVPSFRPRLRLVPAHARAVEPCPGYVGRGRCLVPQGGPGTQCAIIGRTAALAPTKRFYAIHNVAATVKSVR